jgi:hypothetical protein
MNKPIEAEPKVKNMSGTHEFAGTIGRISSHLALYAFRRRSFATCRRSVGIDARESAHRNHQHPCHQPPFRKFWSVGYFYPCTTANIGL